MDWQDLSNTLAERYVVQDDQGMAYVFRSRKRNGAFSFQVRVGLMCVTRLHAYPDREAAQTAALYVLTELVQRRAHDREDQGVGQGIGGEVLQRANDGVAHSPHHPNTYRSPTTSLGQHSNVSVSMQPQSMDARQ